MNKGNGAKREDGAAFSLRDIRDHMPGPVLSLILHVLLAAFLSTVIIVKKEKPEKGIIIEIKEYMKIPPGEIIPEPPEPVCINEKKKTDIEVKRPDMEVEDIDVPGLENFGFTLPAPVPRFLKPSNSILILPGVYSARSDSERENKIKIYAATHAHGVVRAVPKGLRWLRDHQNPDGSWGDGRDSYSPSLTGLALLAFLGYNKTPASPEYGDCVYRAIKRLIAWVEEGRGKIEGKYNHPIVIYALSEAYGMLGTPMLEEPVARGIEVIVSGQNSRGSFNYNYDNSKERSDLSVAGWNFQALKAACSSGIKVSGIEECMDGVIRSLHTVHKAEEGFNYSGGSRRNPQMTAVGALCLVLGGHGKGSKVLDTSAKALCSRKLFECGWDIEPEQLVKWAMYRWYYQTQVLFQLYSGRAPWKKWNDKFAPAFIKNQHSDGHWNTPMAEDIRFEGAKGHGESMFRNIDGPVYATVFSCLTLEVYHRYLPTYRARAVSAKTAE